MPLMSRSGKDRARVLRVIAHGDQFIERFADVPLERLRSLAADVNPDLTHDRDRFRSHGGSDRPGAVRVELRPTERSQQSFGHLGPSAVVRADEKHPGGYAGHGVPSLPSAPPGRSANDAGSGRVPSSMSQ